MSRLQITDIKVGDGEVAETGKGVVVQWVLRRMNGYYVSASSEGDGEPFIYRVSELKRISRVGGISLVAAMRVALQFPATVANKLSGEERK